MKFTFLSNYFNHHQKYISNELSDKSSSYHFISTSKMRDERKSLGYGENFIPDYVIDSGENTKEYIEKIIAHSDAVIFGAAPISFIKKRMKDKQLIFKYSERPIKKKNNIFRPILRFFKWHFQYFNSSNMFLLCASAYAYYDFNRYGMFKNKAYKWGYFPETKHYNVEELFRNKDKTQILWCGRFIDWKHPDDVLKAVSKLKAEGYSFSLDYIGTGVMEEQLKRMVKEYTLDGYVSFLGAMKPDEVRSYMEKAGIYLFTSDKQEGWGAVLNESMNSGCAVVASHAIGSVPFLIENNKNGLIYESGNVDMIYEKIKYLLDNPDEQVRLGSAAYGTITELWNAEVAVERLIKLTKEINNGNKYPDLYESGPCSKAEIIEDNYLF